MSEYNSNAYQEPWRKLPYSMVKNINTSSLSFFTVSTLMIDNNLTHLHMYNIILYVFIYMTHYMNAHIGIKKR